MLHPRQFRNIDNRRVLDDEWRQGIDGVTGLGLSSEVLCGRLLEELLEKSSALLPDQLDDYIAVLFHVRGRKNLHVSFRFSPVSIGAHLRLQVSNSKYSVSHKRCKAQGYLLRSVTSAH